jgi:hypothetical protein
MKASTALGLVLATALVAGCSDKGPTETTASAPQDIIIGGSGTVAVSLDSSTSSATLRLPNSATTLGVFQGALAYQYRCGGRLPCSGTLQNAGFVLDDFTTTVNLVNAATGLSMTAQVTFRNPRVDILGNPAMGYSSQSGYDVPAGTLVGVSGIVSGCFLDVNGACSTSIPLTFETTTGTLSAPLYISAGPSPTIHGTFSFQLAANATLAGIPVTFGGPAAVSLLAYGS